MQPHRFPPGCHHLLFLAASPLPGARGAGVRTAVLSLPKQQTAGGWHMLSSRLLPYQQRCQRLHQMYKCHSPTSHLHLSRVMSDWQLVSLSFNFPSGAKCLWKFFGSAFLPKWQKHLYGTVTSSLNHDCTCRVSLFRVVNCGIPEAVQSKEKLFLGLIFCLLWFSAWSRKAVKHRTSLLWYLAKDAQLEKHLWQIYTSGKRPHYAKKWSQQHKIASPQSFPLSTLTPPVPGIWKVFKPC